MLAITSVGWCIPRYNRESATATGRPTARIHASERTMVFRTSDIVMRARPTYRTMAAAACPDGKLEVGGPASRWGTAGRSRSTMNVVVTNVVTSITSAPTRNAIWAQWRPIDRMRAATAAMPTTVSVSPSLDPQTVSSSNVGVRWSKNQRSSPRSQLPTAPSRSILVSRRPRPTSRTVMKT